MPVQVMPDDHSKLVPPLPIPNRTVKQLCADDSAATSVKGREQLLQAWVQSPTVGCSRHGEIPSADQEQKVGGQLQRRAPQSRAAVQPDRVLREG